jgi:hypothetical protein
MRSDRLLACALGVTCVTLMSACADDRTSPGTGANGTVSFGIFPAPDQTRVLEYPVEGVDLGQGWHREGVRKAVATCIDFAAREDTGQEQSMELSVITDSSALMETLDISAEAQFKSIGYSVSGKAKFAKDTEVRSSSLNVLAYAKVMNGVAYVAPTGGGSRPGRIDLAPHYRDLARRDRLAFEQECGDGFVAALYSGAELTAVLSFSETSTTERTAIETAMRGSGWGFSAAGAANRRMENAAKAGKLRVTFYQTGGSGSPIPTTQAGFVSAIERLPAVAAQDPYYYHIQVLSYQALPGYPSGVPAEHDEFRQALATSYGRLLTLRSAVIEALEAAEQTTPAVNSYVDAQRDQTPLEFHRRMEALHDDLADRLRRIRALAESCTFYDEDMGPRDPLALPCRLTPDLDLRNDYAYRLRLPVLRSSAAGGKTASDIHAAIIDQHVREVSRRRCERNLEDPGCLLERQIDELRKKL